MLEKSQQIVPYMILAVALVCTYDCLANPHEHTVFALAVLWAFTFASVAGLRLVLTPTQSEQR